MALLKNASRKNSLLFVAVLVMTLQCHDHLLSTSVSFFVFSYSVFLPKLVFSSPSLISLCISEEIIQLKSLCLRSILFPAWSSSLYFRYEFLALSLAPWIKTCRNDEFYQMNLSLFLSSLPWAVNLTTQIWNLASVAEYLSKLCIVCHCFTLPAQCTWLV